ncbi:MAG: CinA family protein [Clostridia bacterium]|nr:CinA family protein [Clostridia bacterium]
MKKLIEILKKNNKTISCMESCTGGMLANEITNVEGASSVFKLGLVTYSNEFKEYFGVSKQTIEEYSVYSNNVSQEMAQNVCRISNSDYSVGITGMLGNIDPNNKCNNVNTVYISIYLKSNNEYYNYEIEAIGKNRIQKKKYIINFVKEKLYGICK